MQNAIRAADIEKLQELILFVHNELCRPADIPSVPLPTGGEERGDEYNIPPEKIGGIVNAVEGRHSTGGFLMGAGLCAADRWHPDMGVTPANFGVA